MTDTWFLAGQSKIDGQWYVFRLDRASLPLATVEAGPYATRDIARGVSAAMRAGSAAQSPRCGDAGLSGEVQ